MRDHDRIEQRFVERIEGKVVTPEPDTIDTDTDDDDEESDNGEE